MMAKKIKKLLIEENMTLTELAKKLNTSSQNLSGKLKRDNFSEKELTEIAEAVGAKFEGFFRTKDDEVI